MKHSFLFVLLLALAGTTGNLTASAQTPEPSGQWKFDNPSNLLASAVGSMQMTPAVAGTSSVTDATLEEAGIVAANGTTADDGAIFVPKNSALKVTRADGASASMCRMLTPTTVCFRRAVRMPTTANSSSARVRLASVPWAATMVAYGTTLGIVSSSP